MEALIQQLRERHIWRALIAYPGAAFILLEAVDFFVDNYELNQKLITASVIVVVGGLPVALLWNWYHGRPGRQALGRQELWSYGLITVATFIAAGWYWATIPNALGEGFVGRGSSADQSIAVLPFEVVDGTTDIEFLSDGLAESLINTLSALPELRVIARSSAFALRDLADHPEEVGRQLNVGKVLVGRLERRGEDLIVSATLVGTRDNSQLWGDRFVRPMAEVLHLEEAIASSIVDSLRLKLSDRAADRISQRAAADPVAYRHYLQGRFLAHGSTADEVDRGLVHLREATRLDPSFPLAYTGIADAMIVKAFFSTSPPSEIVGEARTAAHSAIALDPELSEAHTALGSIRFFFDHDWQGSEEAFRTAIALGPTNSTTYYRYANLLIGLLRFDEAVDIAERAVEIDPLSTGALHAVGFAKLWAGDFEGAAEAFGHAIEIHPGWTWGHVKKGLSHALAGQHAEALVLAERAEELSEGWGSAFLQGWLAWIYSVTDSRELLDRTVERVEHGMEENRIEDPIAVVATYLAAGDLARALDWAERTVEAGSPNAVFMSGFLGEHMDPLAPSGFRESPRFLAALRRMGLPQN